MIVGRRSFGKGLVQEEYPVGGGALRLTVSRYYTPSGRCIQTPYGAAAPPRDSTSSTLEPADPLVYFTDAGREVYGGGGIAPDLEVARDTSAGRRALAEALWLGWPGYHVEELIEANRHAYAQIEDEYAWAATWRSLDLGVDSLAADALAFHPDYSPALLEEFSEALGQFLARRIAHQLWGPGASYFIGAQYSPIIQRAVLALQSEEELDLSPAASDSLPSEQHNESQNELQN